MGKRKKTKTLLKRKNMGYGRSVISYLRFWRILRYGQKKNMGKTKKNKKIIEKTKYGKKEKKKNWEVSFPLYIFLV